MSIASNSKIKVPQKFKLVRLYDFNVNDSYIKSENNESINIYKDNKKFVIQMFGINSLGQTICLYVTDFNPFFYIKVDNSWDESTKTEFIAHLRKKMGSYYEDSIVSSQLIKKHKLYGFDKLKLHNFIKINFANCGALNKCKKIFYKDTIINNSFNRELLKDGYVFNNTNCYLYEGNIPPLLKLFHIQEITPSGWILIPNNKIKKNVKETTHCVSEYNVSYKDIQNVDKESIVKYNICSFDIEASSSHGDFPLAIKDYKKLTCDILESYNNIENKDDFTCVLFKNLIFTAFSYNKLKNINKVYTKAESISEEQLSNIFDNFIKYIPANDKTKKKDIILENNDSDSESETEENTNLESNETPNYVFKKQKRIKSCNDKNSNILDIITNNNYDYDTKFYELNYCLTKFFPPLQGDEVTFIGLTFINYGDTKPYKRVIIVKGGCKIPEKYKSWVKDNNVTILEKSCEKGVLLEFTKTIQTENPHIITGYNIMGFDFQFMFERSKELNITEKFLKLSRNRNEVCIKKDWKTGEEDIESTKIMLASGEYNLKYIKMAGRIIIDMCIVFRREYNLSSYKLDYTSSYFISDSVKSIELNKENNSTKIYSKNLTGLSVGTFIKFEEISYSNNYYKKGQKFEIIEINNEESWFVINSYEDLNINNKFTWGLAKDDVTPQQIFSLSNGSDYDRWTVGKYCLADCDNVIWLLLKTDIITSYIEMSNLCSVPMGFLLQRGQGIKLQSYVSKKCGEKNTLMPTIEKDMNDGGYEGAHVFTPKTGLYLHDPVACVDYSSLYPSSIISENLSHDSKVWSKEYDLSDNLLHSTGEKDENNNFIYDNLEDEGYSYVDIKYDTYKYIRPNPKAAAKKVIIGYKICRFAQFPEGKAIMPSILQELLAARKATRKLIPQQTDDFMKNILDKRQLSIKMTANSLYGQCGAKTSAFFEQDVAASTTATGRKLLFYARAVIEECYNDIEIQVSDGNIVKTRAECVYGDTDSVFFKFNLRDINNKKIIDKQALIYTIELAKEAGELATKFLKKPHDLEYEKTFWPFNLLSKKRYDGMLYEDDPEKCKLKSMGNVLKRRDNAPIVKDVYGGVVGILMKDKNLEKSIKFVHECLNNMINEKYPIEKLLVTKSLRGHYKNPKQIAHKVLSERIGLRENGNKPGAGDRINYAFVKNPNKKALQGEKIETPEFIKENNLKLDYGHYISNQIMKPLLQLYALELENMSEFKEKQSHIKLHNTKKELLWSQHLEKLKEKWVDVEKYEKKLEELKCKEVKLLLFDSYLKKLA